MRGRVLVGVTIAGLLYGCGDDAGKPASRDVQSSGGKVDSSGGANAGGSGGTLDEPSSLGGNSQQPGEAGAASTFGGRGSGGVGKGYGGSSSGGAGKGIGGGSSGGPTNGLGGVSTGGSVLLAAAGMGDRDTSKCVLIPHSKVAASIGIFMYGPDPGPCSSAANGVNGVESTRYVYSGGLVATIESNFSTKTYFWDQNVLTGYQETTSTATSTVQVMWTDDTKTEKLASGAVQTYRLSPTGYPLEAWSGEPPNLLLMRYEYSDCRIARRVAFYSDGSVNDAITSVFEYDLAGHIAAQRFGNGTVVTFDYGCW